MSGRGQVHRDYFISKYLTFLDIKLFSLIYYVTAALPFCICISFIQKGTLFTYLLKNNASLFQTLGVRLMNNTMGDHKLLPLEILTQK